MNEFAQFGFEGARIDRIALKAKANKAMIYYYYKSKENLYETILTNLYSTFFNELSSVIPKEKRPDNQLFSAINTFINYISSIDENYIRIMLREIADGGKYFKKLALPNLIIPMLTLIQGIIEEGKKKGQLKDIHEHFTYFMVVGSVVFFNAIKLTIGDTDFGKQIFSGNSVEVYKNNLISIFKSGILK